MLWQSILEKIATAVEPYFESTDTRWAVIGSAATALQGCRVNPGDIDILTEKPEDVILFVEALHAHLPAQPVHPRDHEGWQSSKHDPVREDLDEYGFYWHFARLYIGGIKAEVAHILPPDGFKTSKDGAGIWEAGKEIWEHIRSVRLNELHIPVVPLEIQLGTNLQRGLDDRANQIVGILVRNGYDEAMIEKSLSINFQHRLQELIQGYIAR